MNIKGIREEKKMTVKKLSQESGVAVGYLSDIENGKAQNPSINVLRKIADALKVPVSLLIENEEAN